MRMKSCLPALLGLVAIQCGLADEVTLKNGDRITGTVVRKEGNTLVLKADALGTLNVPWDQVVEMRADKPLHLVLADGRTLEGTPVLSQDEIRIAGTRAALSRTEVVTIRNEQEQAAYERTLHPSWTRLWTGMVTVGLAGAQGNAQTRTFTAGWNADRTTNTDKTSLHLSAVKASAVIGGVSAGTAQAVRGGWAYNRSVQSRLFVNTFNDYEYDRFQALDLRFVLGGGIGCGVWKGERSKLDLIGGGAYNHEKFSPPAPAIAFSRDSAEAYWGDDYAWKLREGTTFVQSFRMFHNLSEAGAWRMNFDAGTSVRLLRWLSWNLNLSNRYLSNQVPGRKKNDLLYSTGLGISFSR